MTRKSDVRLIKGWLLDADEITDQANDVPEGWEHSLLIALAPEGQPYYFFLTLVEPDAEHEGFRYFAGWVERSVAAPFGTRQIPWIPGKTGDLRPRATLAEAQASLRADAARLAGTEPADFDAEWKRANAVVRAMRKNRELR